MKIWRNDCVGCTGAGLPCQGRMCPYHDDYEVHICDECGRDIEDMYIVEDRELCAECAGEEEEQ